VGWRFAETFFIWRLSSGDEHSMRVSEGSGKGVHINTGVRIRPLKNRKKNSDKEGSFLYIETIPYGLRSEN
jgi:hypothetical protein